MRIKTLGWRNHPRNHVSFKGCNLNLNNVMVQDAVFLVPVFAGIGIADILWNSFSSGLYDSKYA